MGFIKTSKNLYSNGSSSGIPLEIENIRVLVDVSQSIFFSVQFIWAPEC
jgi:hypothetical protein